MNTPSDHESKSTTKTLRILGVAVLAAAFGIAPNPAFAQHGGGGGGGHSGGGGGHASSGSSSGGHVSGGAPVHASAPHATVGGAGRPTGGTSMAPRAGTASMANFNAARNHFVNPPGSISSRSSRAAARPFYGSFNPAVVQPRSPFLGHRRGFFFGEGGCFNGFFPGFCGGFFPFGFGGGFGFGFGYGFGPWGYGYDGYGYSNYGYPYDSSMSGDIEANVEGQTANMENRLEENPYYGAEAESLSNGSPSGANSDANAPLVMLYLKDGSVYALSNYWVADGKLHYKTQYGGENSVPLDQIDIQHTVDVNAKRGVNITLRPAPAAAPAPQPSPSPNAAPAPQPNAAPAPQPNAAPNSAANPSPNRFSQLQ
jgi:hypothetical protein